MFTPIMERTGYNLQVNVFKWCILPNLNAVSKMLWWLVDQSPSPYKEAGCCQLISYRLFTSQYMNVYFLTNNGRYLVTCCHLIHNSVSLFTFKHAFMLLPSKNMYSLQTVDNTWIQVLKHHSQSPRLDIVSC